MHGQRKDDMAHNVVPSRVFWVVWGEEDQYGRRTTLSLSLLIDAVVLKVLHSTTTTTTRVVQLLSLLGCSRQHRPCIIRFFVCHKLLTWLIFFLRHHNNNHLFFCWMCGWQVRLLYVTPTSFWVVFFFFFNWTTGRLIGNRLKVLLAS